MRLLTLCITFHQPPHCSVQMHMTEDEEQHVTFHGLSQHLVSSEEEAVSLLLKGHSNRAIGSDHSHFIFSVDIEAFKVI